MYEACMLCTLLHGSKAWTQTLTKNADSVPSTWGAPTCILGITWEDCGPNKNVLAMAGILSMCSLLTLVKVLALAQSAMSAVGWRNA